MKVDYRYSIGNMKNRRNIKYWIQKLFISGLKKMQIINSTNKQDLKFSKTNTRAFYSAYCHTFLIRVSTLIKLSCIIKEQNQWSLCSQTRKGSSYSQEPSGLTNCLRQKWPLFVVSVHAHKNFNLTPWRSLRLSLNTSESLTTKRQWLKLLVIFSILTKMFRTFNSRSQAGKKSVLLTVFSGLQSYVIIRYITFDLKVFSEIVWSTAKNAWHMISLSFQTEQGCLKKRHPHEYHDVSPVTLFSAVLLKFIGFIFIIGFLFFLNAAYITSSSCTFSDLHDAG